MREESLERRTKEECLLFKQLTEKQKFWETVFSEKENEIASMQKKMDELAAEKHEYDVLKQEFNTLRLKCNIMQEDQTILESELNQYKVKVRENAEEKSRLENLLSEMQNEYSSLKQVYCTERSELEAQKEELRRLHAKLDSLMEERKEGNEELHLDKLEEAVSLMDQLREEYSLLTGEKLSLLKKVDELKVELEVQGKSCFVRCARPLYSFCIAYFLKSFFSWESAAVFSIEPFFISSLADKMGVRKLAWGLHRFINSYASTN